MAFMDVNPKFQALLTHTGLIRPEDVLDLPGVIVSGHPGRNVARIALGSPRHRLRAFLKREYMVRWQDRVANALAGFGLVSRSRREALVLRAVADAGGGGPEWLACGEDDHGRAFLLTAEAGRSVDLRVYLREVRRPRPDAASERRRLARDLGENLARLHRAGFHHRGLYAKHVLIDPATGDVTFLDWQRARLRRGAADWAARLHDLAALHATLAEQLASDRERLVFLRTYLKACGQEGPDAGLVVRRVGELARELLRKRHVREVRSSLPSAGQGLLWLDGEALCVTPEFHARLNGRVPNWLRCPGAPKAGLTQTVVPLPGGRRGLLTWRRQWSPFRWLGSRLWPRPLLTPEVREAGLLFRRQRLGQGAPRLLAFGQRSRFPGHSESFLLTELPDQARRTA
jgi:tRNA A-37 threonylcarbamoyl transferase component Bud32